MGKCEGFRLVSAVIALDSNLNSAFKSPRVTARLIPPGLNHTRNVDGRKP